jgi:hypothetical protein
MLKEILSITGKPGLFKLVSQGKNMLIVESLIDGKRIPIFTKDKVVSLGDIAIFTDADDILLEQVLAKIKEKENGALCSVDSKADNNKLCNYMAEILPEYDRDRVYPSDIRKLVSWYNILINAQITDFEVEEKIKEEIPEASKEVKKDSPNL